MSRPWPQWMRALDARLAYLDELAAAAAEVREFVSQLRATLVGL